MTKEEHDAIGIVRKPEDAVIITKTFLDGVRDLAKDCGFHSLFVLPVMILERDASTPTPEESPESLRIGQTGFGDGCGIHLLQALASALVQNYDSQALGYFAQELGERMAERLTTGKLTVIHSDREQAAADFFQMLNDANAKGKPN